MGKRILTAIAVFLLCSNSADAYDIVNINYDDKTLTQLELNTAAQVATNVLHNQQVDTIKQRQKRLMVIVDGIMAEKELIIATYKNVSGFKQESKYYKALVVTGADIINHSEKAIQAIEGSKLSGKVKAILSVSDLVAQAIGLGKAFADIVANSEVTNPVNHPDATSGDGDRHNLLNRHERLKMANDILWRLRGIDHQICFLTYLARTSNWRDVLFQLDRKTFLNYITARRDINDMVRKWERVHD